LDLDPDLGALLDEQRREAAASELLVRLLRLSRGAWAGGEMSSTSPDHVGLLVVSGAIAREVVLADTISTELIGPGDLIRPWSACLSGPPLLGQHVRWQVLADARLAVLSRSFGTAVLRYPEINSMLLDRLNGRAERLATLKAIVHLNSVDRRLVALFWHLAERWGRMTATGVVVPLTLSHRLLGELVGARRPTVSTAVAKLAREGKLVRRTGGDWLLAHEPEGTPSSVVEHMVAHRRRLLAV
ncbi:MAG: Crp/Fnr family transcriptional regulator, partial [Solirubrobacterales bacterium]|nr:Crp/Fnr family transcriptional regulator [Solirubrobacterales bacterium]